jgi:hypothetical protein
MIKKYILSMIFMAAVSGIASGASITIKWTGTDSNDWGTASNWDANRVPILYSLPDKGDYVWINYLSSRPEGCTIYSGDRVAYNVNVMREGIDDNTKTVIFNLKGGSLTISGWELKLGMGTYSYYVAHPQQPYSVVNMYDGFTLNITGTGGITIGDYYDGEFNMYGGVYNHNAGGFRVSNSAYNGGLGYGAGTLNLYGGRINVYVGNGLGGADIRAFTPTSKINISDGNMALVGDNVSTLQGYANQGKIAAIGGKVVIIRYVAGEGKTYLQAEYPTKAHNPSPSDTATEVNSVGTVLSWSPATDAVRHKVYFGIADTNLSLIAEMNEPQRSVSLTTLDYGQKYFWRVDEVNSSGGVAQGYQWSFTASDGIVIDLFESYNDANPITTNWTSAGSGTILLESQKAFDTVYQGNQSLKLNYNNSNTYSEAVYTYVGTSNWTANQVKSLSFAVHGLADNIGDLLYTAIEDSNGTLSQVVTYSNDPCSIVQTKYSPWLLFNIDLADFGTSVDLTKIKKVRIGVGNRSNPTTTASGTIHIDSIKLYPVRCLGEYAATDLTGECFINFADLARFAMDWGNTGSPVAPHKAPILKYDFENTSNPAKAFDVAGSYDGNIVDVDGSGSRYDTIEDINAFLFVGYVYDIGISIPAAAFAGFHDEITVSLWAYGDTGQGSGTTYAFKFALANGNLLFGTLPSAGGYIYTLMGQSADNMVYHPFLPSAYSGRWIHWAFVRNFKTGEMSMYTDGRKVAYKSDASTASSVFSTISYAWVGARELSTDVTKPDTSYRGWMDDFQIFDYALSQQEIIYLANQSFNADMRTDFNHDNNVDLKDMAEIAGNWLKEILWP